MKKTIIATALAFTTAFATYAAAKDVYRVKKISGSDNSARYTAHQGPTNRIVGTATVVCSNGAVVSLQCKGKTYFSTRNPVTGKATNVASDGVLPTTDLTRTLCRPSGKPASEYAVQQAFVAVF